MKMRRFISRGAGILRFVGILPGRVKLDVRIDLPRPRDLRLKREARFIEYERTIWESIREEVLRTESRARVA